MAGFPVAFAVLGERVDARVLERHETVSIDDNGQWTHDYSLTVRYRPGRLRGAAREGAADSMARTLVATAALHDATPVGATVGVVYLPQRPELAKFADIGWLDVMGEKAQQPGMRIALLVIGIFGIGVALIGWAPRSEAGRGLRRAWLAACVVGVLGGLVWDVIEDVVAPVQETAFTETADAVVQQVRRITKRSTHESVWDLAYPFDVAHVAFTPPGHDLPVHAAAAIDAGSVAGLARGARVRVRYVPGAARTIRIEGGGREFVKGNAVDRGREWLLIVGGSAALMLPFVLLAWRRRRM